MSSVSSSSVLPHTAPQVGAAGSRTDAARPARWMLALGGACALVLLAATLEVVLDAALGHSPLTPGSPGIAGWLKGIGERLGFRVFLIALLSFTAAYALLLGLARRLAQDRRAATWAIVLVGTLNVIVLAGPVLFSTDVFSYIAYARMGVLHGIDPYLHGPIAINGDGIYRYVGNDWRKVATAYGPLYTLISYPLGLLGLKGAVWGAKIEALVASAGTLALTWRCARIRGYDPAVALVAVGCNPLYVLYGLGGAHNDLIMTCFMMAAVALILTEEEGPRRPGRLRTRGPARRPGAGGATLWASWSRLGHPPGVDRDALAGAAVVGAALVKATGAVLLPFMLLARRSWGGLAGAGAALVAVAVVSYPVFGLHGLDVVSALNRDAALVSTDSFPTELAHLVGKPGVFPVDHVLLKVALVAIVAHLLWRTWRGYDWVSASGWTLLAISVTSTWLLAWYTLWVLPLAVVARDRRLLIATFAVQGLFIVHQTAPLFSP
ncbi:MAG TPA: glycosyltransferase 87 family protein, partial [Solirubrobacteraceae bacterium]|nr:glycosyltransferase 87 family protein [Solirubrobacteraceae bacterium]